MTQLQQVLPPNRIAVIASILTSLVAFITGLAKVLPGTWESYALAGTGLAGQIITTLKFLEGSQKFDALQSREKLAGVAPLPASDRGPSIAYAAPSQDE